MTDQQRRETYNREYRAALKNFKPNMPGRYSGQQVAAAKGLARKRTLAIIDNA
jgi:hypothetical protein